MAVSSEERRLCSLILWRNEIYSRPETMKHPNLELAIAAVTATLSLFSGALISGGHFSVAINTFNQSPTLSVREENPSKTYKRIKPLDSDSD